MTNNYCIYLHKNKINGKVYIGQTSQKPELRWRNNGKGYQPAKGKSPTKFYSAILKYGWNNFEHIILEDNLTLEEANSKEEYYINEFKARDDKYGYNIQKGGKNHQITEEVKKKISKTKINQHLEMSEENKKRLKERNSGAGNPFYEHKHTEETKKKMSENHTNVKGKNNPNAKKVLCVENKKIFGSAREAAEFCHRSTSAINNCISGRSKTAGGYHWIRWEEEKND